MTELFLPNGSLYKTKQERLVPGREVDDILNEALREATQSVEAELALEDAGWINLSQQTGEVVTDKERIANVKLSRLYYTKDPLGRQAIRLWTDYTFGSGMTFQAPEEKTQEVLTKYWQASHNRSVLSARGQRKSSDKVLVDGEIFMVQFLGSDGKVTIRWIDPLEITELITDPDDREDVLFYRREWSDQQGTPHITIYRSINNIANKPAIDAQGKPVKATDDGIVSHLTYNTIGQRGNPLLLPALDWIKQYRRFLASRVAVMLALARFAWKTKVVGGQAAVDSIRAKTNEKEIAAGSNILENLGSDTTPIKTDSGAKNASEDGRMLKLQISAATGWPEQYFGDISTGNLATAKTVELPVLKMIQSFQKVWEDYYQGMDEVVLDHNNISPDNWYVDRDFPPIAPRDAAAIATAVQQVVQVFPAFADVNEVKHSALMALGIDDTAKVIEELEKMNESVGNTDVALTREVRKFIKIIEAREKE